MPMEVDTQNPVHDKGKQKEKAPEASKSKPVPSTSTNRLNPNCNGTGFEPVSVVVLISPQIHFLMRPKPLPPKTIEGPPQSSSWTQSVGSRRRVDREVVVGALWSP